MTGVHGDAASRRGRILASCAAAFALAVLTSCGSTYDEDPLANQSRPAQPSPGAATSTTGDSADSSTTTEDPSATTSDGSTTTTDAANTSATTTTRVVPPTPPRPTSTTRAPSATTAPASATPDTSAIFRCGFYDRWADAQRSYEYFVANTTGFPADAYEPDEDGNVCLDLPGAPS